MTDIELKERAERYRRLIEFEPFQHLVIEMQKKIVNITVDVASDLNGLRLVDKGRIMGIQEAISTPFNAVAEVDSKTEDSEPR